MCFFPQSRFSTPTKKSMHGTCSNMNMYKYAMDQRSCTEACFYIHLFSLV